MQRQKTVIHFVRHGEVENPESLRYGRLPGFHLSATGRKQVSETTLYLLNRKIEHIYASPLERTQQTATLLGLAYSHLPISLDARLLETKTSAKFEGKVRDMHFYYALNATPDAETFDQIFERYYHFIEEKVIAHNGREIIAVAHADPIAITYSKLVYNDHSVLRGCYPSYASVYSFVYWGLELKEVWYYSPLQNGNALPVSCDEAHSQPQIRERSARI